MVTLFGLIIEAIIEKYVHIAKSKIEATLSRQMAGTKKKWGVLLRNTYTPRDPQRDLKFIYGQCVKRLNGYQGLKVDCDIHYQLNTFYLHADRSCILLLVKI